MCCGTTEQNCKEKKKYELNLDDVSVIAYSKSKQRMKFFHWYTPKEKPTSSSGVVVVVVVVRAKLIEISKFNWTQICSG